MRIAALILLGFAIVKFAFAVIINLYHGANIYDAFGGIWSIAVFSGLILAFVYILKTKVGANPASEA